MPADIIPLNALGRIKELQDQLEQKQQELEALQKQFDEYKYSVLLLTSANELLKLQINEIMSFLQNNIKNYQATLQNLDTIKKKLPSYPQDK